MPSYLQAASRVLPLTYLNNGLRDAMVFGNVGSALTNLAVVAFLAGILFVLAAKLMSWKER
jgi:ABC-2 type transport system permease protein